MITCPRCGYQAPDGTPWCPNCGYGCPYPMPYQPQQVPPQYDVIDVTSRPNQHLPKAKKYKKKNRKLPKIFIPFLIGIGLFVVGFLSLVVAAIVDPSVSTPIATTESIGSVVRKMIDQNATEAMAAILSATPTFTATNTEVPTNTPTLTDTPVPTDTPVTTNTPVPTATVSKPIYSGSASDRSGILGSTVQDTVTNTCAVKGSNNGIYHCKNSPNYNTMKNYVCFSSQADAEAAGYKMSGNQHGWCQQ